MNDDTWVTCPYNKAHRALKSRFQIHLTKCRENHKGQGGQKQCPYDANHIVNAVEFEYHLGECESRLSVLHFQSQDQEVRLNVPPATRPLMIVPAQSEEDWETEAAGGSCYQPGENLADLPVFIQPTGLAPAERKNFRRNERSRHQYIENKGNTWKPTDSFVNKKIVQPVHTERKAKLSTSSCESFNSSNPPETPESFEAPAPITAWKALGESEISSSKSECLEVEASSSTGTVPPAQPVFSYANAARKAKEAAAADPKAVEQSITFVMRADPKADEQPKTVATRADPMVVDEQPKKVATSGSSLSWRSVVAESNKKEIESPLNRSASSVESSSSAGTTTQAKSTFNYANAAKKVKEAADTKVDRQPRVIAAKVDEQPKVITTTNSSMSWRSVVVESNMKEMESSLNTSSSSGESSSSVGVETQLKAIVNYANAAKTDRRVRLIQPPRSPPAQSNSTFNYANVAKKPKEADPIVDEPPKTCATTNSSSSSLPWRSAAVAKKKEIENPSAASVPEPKSTFNYASVAKKEKEADAAAVADEQPKSFARMATSSSSAWRSAAESDKKETESSTSRSTSPVKSVWSAVAASQTKSTTLNYANLANKLKAAEPKVGGASYTGTTTAASQTKSTLNYANLATKFKGAEPKAGKPTKTFDEMHRQLLKSFAKINFKSNVNKFQFSSTDSNNYY